MDSRPRPGQVAGTASSMDTRIGTRLSNRTEPVIRGRRLLAVSNRAAPRSDRRGPHIRRSRAGRSTLLTVGKAARMHRGLLSSIVCLAVLAVAAADASANDYRGTTVYRTVSSEHAPGPSCAAPVVTYHQPCHCCCRPEKKGLFDRLCDLEKRKNRWLLKQVKKCLPGHRNDCCHCCPQPCCSAPQPCCAAPEPTCVAPQPTCAAPQAACGCGN